MKGIIMEKYLNGKLVSDVLYSELKKYLLLKDQMPSIVDISIGNDFGGLMYSKMKKKAIERETQINFKSVHFENITFDNLKSYIISLNDDSLITGIMIQLPLPDKLRTREREILNLIDYHKDVDGLTSMAAGLLSVNEDCLMPCTAIGIETLLKAYNIELMGKRVVILNRSNIVGKPIYNIMLKNDATPTICHSKTINLPSITREADILIIALNKQEFITEEYVKNGAIIVDVGVHKNSDGKTVGDVDLANVFEKVSYITPPTSSVGPMTICMLAYNSVKCLYGKEVNEVLERGIEKAKKLILK